LYARTNKAVHEIDSKLTALIHKWHHLNAGVPMSIEKYDGSVISYEGIVYKGSPVTLFWNGFIEPNLENYALEVLKQTSALAIECQFPVAESVDEAQNLLLVLIRRIYNEMAEVDSVLKGNGFELSKKVDVSGKILSMSESICQHAAIERMKKPSSGNLTYNIESIKGKNIQLGSNNKINFTTFQEFTNEISASGDIEAITILKNLLINKTASRIIGAEASELLTMLMGNE
jgi:hypothetical protein